MVGAPAQQTRGHAPAEHHGEPRRQRQPEHGAGRQQRDHGTNPQDRRHTVHHREQGQRENHPGMNGRMLRPIAMPIMPPLIRVRAHILLEPAPPFAARLAVLLPEHGGDERLVLVIGLDALEVAVDARPGLGRLGVVERLGLRELLQGFEQ